MKFKVNSRELRDAIGKIIGVVPIRTTIPAIENLLLDATKKKLSISATDLEISMTTQLDIVDGVDGKVTVNAKEFFDIIRNLDESEIEVSLDENLKLSLKTKSGSYRFACTPAEEYPTLPTISEGAETSSIATDMLRSVIEKTIFAVSKDEHRRSMNGVLFLFSGRGAKIYSTDGHRLVRIEDKALVDKPLKKEANIQEKALSLAAKCFRGASVEVTIADEHIKLKAGETELVSRLIKEPHPDYEAVIPGDIDNNKIMSVSRGELLEKVRRVAILSDSVNHLVKFTIDKDNLTISTEDTDRGEMGEERLLVQWNGGEQMNIGFNSTYVTDAMNSIDAQKVKFAFSTSTRAATIKPILENGKAGAQEMLVLVMPLRLS
ncbi:MAG TPA: DNA polymerase III subunit beta [Candidatus Acidoferrales bacterium]|nr:DNA polymerase III subunit beta [Candidatus Acidoferrales bacterium]